LFLFYS